MKNNKNLLSVVIGESFIHQFKFADLPTSVNEIIENHHVYDKYTNAPASKGVAWATLSYLQGYKDATRAAIKLLQNSHN